MKIYRNIQNRKINLTILRVHWRPILHLDWAFSGCPGALEADFAPGLWYLGVPGCTGGRFCTWAAGASAQ